MATVYRCDGCDKEDKSYNPFTTVTVTYDSRVREDEASQTYDFCTRCLGTFKRDLTNLTTVRNVAA